MSFAGFFPAKVQSNTLYRWEPQRKERKTLLNLVALGSVLLPLLLFETETPCAVSGVTQKKGFFFATQFWSVFPLNCGEIHVAIQKYKNNIFWVLFSRRKWKGKKESENQIVTGSRKDISSFCFPENSIRNKKVGNIGSDRRKRDPRIFFVSPKKKLNQLKRKRRGGKPLVWFLGTVQ